jgi:hypothetical protein
VRPVETYGLAEIAGCHESTAQMQSSLHSTTNSLLISVMVTSNNVIKFLERWKHGHKNTNDIVLVKHMVILINVVPDAYGQEVHELTASLQITAMCYFNEMWHQGFGQNGVGLLWLKTTRTPTNAHREEQAQSTHDITLRTHHTN